MPDIHEIHRTARKMLTRLLDEAEARNFDPPADMELVADLEWIISETAGATATAT